MSSTAAVAPRTRTMLDDLLDRTPVTDRVFHDLKHTQPLVESLVDRSRLLSGEGAVLVIAPNVTLPAALIEQGYQVALWHVSDGILTADLVPFVERSGPLDELLSASGDEGRFDLIILPFVLEAVTEHPTVVLSRLREMLVPAGRIVLASRRPGGITERLRALSGSTQVPDPSLAAPPPSFSWPPLPQRRLFGAGELRRWSQQAGLRVAAEAPVVERTAALPIHALDLGAWLQAEVTQGVRVAFPSLRDCVLYELAAVPGSVSRLRTRSHTRADHPYVTVAVTRPAMASLDYLLARLAEQSYPAYRFEVLVVTLEEHEVLELAREWPFAVRTVQCGELAGPVAANALLRAAHGDVVAYIDDLGLPPRGWLDIGVDGLTGYDVGLTGRITAHGLSALPFLALPGWRPISRDQGWFSASNTFYLREAALEAGGFEEPERGAPARLGWDNTLVERMRALGYTARFEPHLYLQRLFPFPGQRERRSWIARELRLAFEVPGVIAREPGLRKTLLWRGVFAARRTMYFDVLLAGVVLAVVFRQPWWLVLAMPWLIAIRTFVPYWPISSWRTGVRNLRGILFRHALWLVGLAAGSVRAGRFVL